MTTTHSSTKAYIYHATLHHIYALLSGWFRQQSDDFSPEEVL